MVLREFRSICGSSGLALAIAALAFGAPAAVQAQTPEVCAVSPQDWFSIFGPEMRGTWTDTTQVSLLNGMPLPLPPPEQVQITPDATGLIGTGGPDGVTWDLDLTDIEFTIEPPAGFNLPNGEDIGGVVGCDVNALPRFYGEQNLEVEGIPATARIWAMAMSSSHMLVWFRFETAMGAISQQSVMRR